MRVGGKGGHYEMVGPPDRTPKRKKISALPPHLAEALREAVANNDTESLYQLIDGIAEHDVEVAAYVRDLVERYDFEALRDVFDVRGR